MSNDKKRTAAEELLNSMMKDLENSKSGKVSLDDADSSLKKSEKDVAETNDIFAALRGHIAKPGAQKASSAQDRTKFIGDHKPESEDPAQKNMEFQHVQDRTVVVRKIGQSGHPNKEPEVKVSFGTPKGAMASSGAPISVTDAHLLQAENLRVAQERITELERELEKLREENEMLSSAADIAKRKAEDFMKRAELSERDRADQAQSAESEVQIFRENMIEKDREIRRLKMKVDELELRLKNDLKKIRVRERELENRLELAKLEKTALVKSKDDTILELKRKLDYIHNELDMYKSKCLEMGQKLDSNHEQLNRTVRALRLALTHLEVSENTNLTIAPYKKAE